MTGWDGWTPLPRPGARTTVEVLRAPEPPLPAPPDRRSPDVVLRPGGRAHVTFRLHAPGAQAVALAASGWWQPQRPEACDLSPRPGGWWQGTFDVPDDWEASYRFLVHDGGHDGRQEPGWWTHGLRDPGAPGRADPLNPHGHGAGRGLASSALWLPGAGERPWLAGFGDTSAVPRRLPTSDDEPRAWWWAPERPVADPLPLLVLLDGEAHAERLGTARVLADAVAAGVLPPVAVVMVASGPDRAGVLGVPGGVARWVGEVLVPRVRRERLGGRRVDADPRRTVVAGSSFGGLSALFAVARFPEALGAAVAQSPSLWRYPAGALVEPLARVAPRVRLRLQAGRYEGPAASEELARALVLRGADVSSQVVTGGHDWAWWVPRTVEAVADLLA
ncbi:alpha/beta hydrolase-fold protein [Isoptericola sp. NPDC058082]|uniref:alpha/beta hydrolase-fold protein n=1 Tax=Isoptericola sp. NPDC058082 TaxID=3346331 RepID=UPI0036E93508